MSKVNYGKIWLQFKRLSTTSLLSTFDSFTLSLNSQTLYRYSIHDKLREEERPWARLQRPLLLCTVSLVSLDVIVSVAVSLAIVFPSDGSNRQFFRDRWAQPFINVTGNFGNKLIYIAERQASNYYLMAVLFLSSIFFLSSVPYLLAGGVWCLSILNLIFAAIFGLLALFSRFKPTFAGK